MDLTLSALLPISCFSHHKGPILAEVLLSDSNLLSINFLDKHAASTAATPVNQPIAISKPAAFLAS
jgi:hypothetical protein